MPDAEVQHAAGADHPERWGSYSNSPVTVSQQEFLGTLFLGTFALILLVALLRAYAHIRQLEAELARAGR